MAGVSDAAIREQMDEIRKEAESRKYVSPPESIAGLAEEYSNGKAELRTKISGLAESYGQLRRVRGDGNCFVRAFGFGLLEALMDEEAAAAAGKEGERHLEAVLQLVRASKEQLVSEGFSEFIDDFWEVLVELLESVQSGEMAVTKESVAAAGTSVEEVHSKAKEKLEAAFNSQEVTEYVICYLRMLTSGYLQRNGELFKFFIEGQNLKEFCATDVEPMYVESDQVQILALASVFDEAMGGAGVRIQYLDASDRTQCNHHDVPDGKQPFVHMLYRPGHYDLLYQRV